MTAPRTWHYGLVASWWAEFNVDGPEIDYFRRFVEAGQPALDVGCGTGRLLLPYLRDGLDVDGCDVSADMVALCREQAAREGLEPALHVQAMHELDLPRRYRTVYVCGSFGLGSTRDQDLQALQRIRRHLEPGGTLVLDNEVPYANARHWRHWLAEECRSLPEASREPNRRQAADGSELAVAVRILELDPLAQTALLEMHAERWRDGTLEAEERHTLSMNLYFTNELVLMLERAGFADVAVYGDHSDEPPTPDSEFVVLVARSQRRSEQAVHRTPTGAVYVRPSMGLRTQVALSVLALSFSLGVLADALFEGQGLGVNVLLWTAAFVGALAALIRPARAPLRQGRRFFVAPALLFSALFAWHDSTLLVASNLFALAAAVAIAGLRRPGPPLARTRLGDYVGGFVATGAATAAGPIPLLERDVAWPEVWQTARSSRAIAVGRGLALTAPLLVLFGALFIAADAVFKGYVTDAIPDVGNPLPRIGIVLGATWLTMGLLRDLLAPRERNRVVSAAALVRRMPRRLSLGALEIGIVLCVLDLLFLAFVLVQFRYLFGGHDVVASRTSLTYAEYARHGFFELVVVCALTLPLLLLCDALLRREKPRHERLFRAQAGVMIALVFVVMASALQRMRLYMDEYGLTELRLYATGAILWLAVVFLWLAVTVLRGRRSRFAVGVVLSGFAATLALNLVNPDALIARTNITRPKVDVAYLAGLSDDAVPTLVDRIETLPPPLRQELAMSLLARSSDGDWRSWSLARGRASRAIENHSAELARLAGG